MFIIVDGGIARFRVYGRASPNWSKISYQQVSQLAILNIMIGQLKIISSFSGTLFFSSEDTEADQEILK